MKTKPKESKVLTTLKFIKTDSVILRIINDVKHVVKFKILS